MTAILGISAFYHDSAAALLIDGRIVAAAQEERFTRNKHDAAFPTHAVQYCLEEAGLRPEQLDYVGFYEKPLLKFDRLLETYLAFAPRGLRSFAKAIPQWARKKLHLRREIRRDLGGTYRGPLVFCEHHESHAASAFFPSPFQDAAILTIDGVGEWATTTIGAGHGNRIQLTDEIRFPHSLGLLYSAFTSFAGFRVNSGEYKLMGLAPFGEPKYADLILRHLIDLRDDGSFHLDMRYFRYCYGLSMTSPRLHRLFGRRPRRPEAPLEQLDMDLAASIQQVVGEAVLRIARHAHRQTGLPQLCMAGGVALNCVANGRLLREGPFEKLWIQPAAGDAGGALGAAMMIWHQLLQRPRLELPGQQLGGDRQSGSLLGPQFSTASIRRRLDALGAVYEEEPDEVRLCERVAELVAQGKVVGWMQGRMEFGPRALGARSILGDPRRSEMQSLINRKIKFRESFRPFAPSVLVDCAREYFDIPQGATSPYMLLVFDVCRSRRRPPDASNARGGLERVSEVRSDLPAVTHLDYSARIQTVDPASGGRYARLLEAFHRQTGCAVMINTSFNVRGEPIVCTPEDAYRCFLATEMDVLVLEDCLLIKQRQTQLPSSEAQAHRARFQAD